MIALDKKDAMSIGRMVVPLTMAILIALLIEYHWWTNASLEEQMIVIGIFAFLTVILFSKRAKRLVT